VHFVRIGGRVVPIEEGQGGGRAPARGKPPGAGSQAAAAPAAGQAKAPAEVGPAQPAAPPPKEGAGAAFVSENAEKVAGKLTDGEKTAVENYTTYLFDAVNRPLREGRPVPDSLQPQVDALDSAIDKSTLDRDVTVYRGASIPEVAKAAADGSLIGHTLANVGFMSTSHGEHVTKFFGGGEDHVLFNITARKGAKALPAAAASKTFGDRQGELIFPRNSRMRVSAVTKTEDGRTMVHAEIVT
jgi:ADP-ribosyltransferase exoenzyme